MPDLRVRLHLSINIVLALYDFVSVVKYSAYHDTSVGART